MGGLARMEFAVQYAHQHGQQFATMLLVNDAILFANAEHNQLIAKMLAVQQVRQMSPSISKTIDC